MKRLTHEQFQKDIKDHGIKVLLDQGLYRHLNFRSKVEDSWNMWFEIVTWPNALEIRGDMGTWSFSRVEDMFTFFRQDKDRPGSINPSYWSEKINAESRYGGPSKKFSMEVFKANVIQSLDGYDLKKRKKAAIIRALNQEVFSGDDVEVLLRMALDKFSTEDFTFQDVWEITGEDYTYHFLWCCYAIVWGIEQYDAK